MKKRMLVKEEKDRINDTSNFQEIHQIFCNVGVRMKRKMFAKKEKKQIQVMIE